MNPDNTISIHFSEYKKLQEEIVHLTKEVALLAIEKHSLKYQLAIKDSLFRAKVERASGE